jgi:RNA polymerase sigma factor (sigma-70 family)
MPQSLAAGRAAARPAADRELIDKILRGDKTALETLILRYQDWIYNVAIRMVGNPADAQDITQEIVIKIITRLGTYREEKASFKTWLYRVTLNHMLNMKKRGLEKVSLDFDNYYSRMEFIYDREPANTREIAELVQDTMTDCVMATLVCLERRPRLVVVLGVIFGLDSRRGAEALGITPDNFRQILSRSRAKLKTFMGRNCSLVNKDAPCVCRLKITELIKAGFRDPRHLKYNNLLFDRRIRDIVGGRVRNFMTKYFYPFHHLFRSHPYWKAPDMLAWLRATLRERDFLELFDIKECEN